MPKKITRLEKSTRIFESAIISKWCYVNIDNEFLFMDKTFVISEKVEDYKVHNKAGTLEDYTNEAYMETVLAVIDKENKLSFYSQNYERLEDKLIKVKE
jgi:TRAP-type uncharacterized transport system substrate-binding protein